MPAGAGVASWVVLITLFASDAASIAALSRSETRHDAASDSWSLYLNIGSVERALQFWLCLGVCQLGSTSDRGILFPLQLSA